MATYLCEVILIQDAAWPVIARQEVLEYEWAGKRTLASSQFRISKWDLVFAVNDRAWDLNIMPSIERVTSRSVKTI